MERRQRKPGRDFSRAMMRSSPRWAVLLFVSVAVAACVQADLQSRPPDPTAKPLKQFSVLTYNTLHGLEVGSFSVKPGESKEERATRYALQFEQLAQIAPDVMLLQEVNPLPDMAEAYVEGLRALGLAYTEVHQVDACGIRLAPRVALFPELNNGLAVLAKAPLQVRKVVGLKLSGGIGWCSDLIGLQFGELRYALIAEVVIPATQRKLLTVSLHLHSGIERARHFMDLITEAEQQGRIRREDYQEVMTALTEGQTRRIGEVRTLVQEVQKLRADGSYAAVIIGGDFNFEPGSPEYRELVAAGLDDSHAYAQRAGKLRSYNPRENPMAGQEPFDPPSELSRAIRRLPEDEQRKILDIYRAGINEARRLDFLFTMPGTVSHKDVCATQELFGKPNVVPLRTGSDHYGVLNTYLLDPSHC